MSSVVDIIKKRRSIRKYKDVDVEYEKILKALDAARYAPSSGNLQNWYFIIVKDPSKIEEIGLSTKQDFVKKSPALVVVCSDDKKVEYFYGERGKLYAIQNVASAIQNFLLALTEEGLGSCWVGEFNEKIVRELLDIPENINVHAIITIGYPDENPTSDRKELKEIVFFEKWGNKIYEPSLYPLMRKLRDILNKFKKVKELSKGS